MTMTPTEALAAWRRTGVIAVLRAPDAARASRTVDALVAGGITGIEVTYTTPDTAEVIRTALDRYGDSVLIGAGTVTKPSQAHEAADAGARFLVTPGTRPEVAHAVVATGVPAMLGAFTASELMGATELGATAVKLFPAGLGGPELLRALRGPFPDVPIVPTGGVRPDNLRAWLAAGALAVGAGGELCSATAIARDDWDEIERRARAFSDALREAPDYMPS
jgi:2-dehydro-3-deoxyphosphogluconate aldolase/(4S)-4-hydroxy-2-oxoglutarate aldolase